MTCAAVLAVLALPLFGELRHGILDETIPGDVQVQSAGENMVMMIVDSRASGRPHQTGSWSSFSSTTRTVPIATTESRRCCVTRDSKCGG